MRVNSIRTHDLSRVRKFVIDIILEAPGEREEEEEKGHVSDDWMLTFSSSMYRFVLRWIRA